MTRRSSHLFWLNPTNTTDCISVRYGNVFRRQERFLGNGHLLQCLGMLENLMQAYFVHLHMGLIPIISYIASLFNRYVMTYQEKFP